MIVPMLSSLLHDSFLIFCLDLPTGTGTGIGNNIRRTFRIE